MVIIRYHYIYIYVYYNYTNILYRIIYCKFGKYKTYSERRGNRSSSFTSYFRQMDWRIEAACDLKACVSLVEDGQLVVVLLYELILGFRPERAPTLLLRDLEKKVKKGLVMMLKDTSHGSREAVRAFKGQDSTSASFVGLCSR